MQVPYRVCDNTRCMVIFCSPYSLWWHKMCGDTVIVRKGSNRCMCKAAIHIHQQMCVWTSRSYTPTDVRVKQSFTHTNRCVCEAAVHIHQQMYMWSNHSYTPTDVCVKQQFIYTNRCICETAVHLHQQMYMWSSHSYTPTDVCVTQPFIFRRIQMHINTNECKVALPRSWNED